MKSNSIHYFILILFVIFACSGFASKGFAQENKLVISAGMQYEYAQQLFEAKDWDTAMVEFKRFIHFFPDSPQKDPANFNIGLCLFNLKKYHDAARKFNEIIIQGKENNFTKEAFFYQSKSFMKIGNEGYAQIVLQNYLMMVDDMETKDRIYFNLVQIHLANARKSKPGSLSLARNYLSKISESGKIKYHTDQYADLIFDAQHQPEKNPSTAGLFAIIPGAGFLYCERYHDALVTFLLNAGLMAATYTAYDHDNYALAGVIGVVGIGFYTGNIYGSISSAHKYNQTQLLNILNNEVYITSKLDPVLKDYELSFNYKF